MVKVKSQAGLWKETKVSFEGEDGADDGGLTVEMHAAFWKGVTSADLELFDCAEDLDKVHKPAFLPTPGACTHSLEMVGLMLCKSLINRHPTGPGLGRFVFDFLLEAEGKRSRAFAKESKPIIEQAETAIVSLSHYDVHYASLCQRYLREETGELRTSESVSTYYGGMAIGELVKLDPPGADHDGHELFREQATVDNLPRAIVASARWVLRESRLPELQALRKGFTYYVDVTTQVRPLPSPDVMLVVQGLAPDTLSAEQLIAQIEWPDTAEAQAKEDDEELSVAEAAGFPSDSTTCALLRHVYSRSPTPRAAPGLAPILIRRDGLLTQSAHCRRSLLCDEVLFPQQGRQDFLQWVVGPRVLPEGGLASTKNGKITLKCQWPGEGIRWTDEAHEDRWPHPVSSTCNVEVTLPNFSLRHVLAKKLLTAIEETKDRNFLK